MFDATVGELEFEEKARRSRIPFSVSQVHRLVVVDEQEVVKGIVSLSDILQALVLTDGYAGESSHSFVGLRRPVFPPHNVCSGFHRHCVRKPQKQDIFLEGGCQEKGAKRAGVWVIITECLVKTTFPFHEELATQNCKSKQRIQLNSGAAGTRCRPRILPRSNRKLHHSQLSVDLRDGTGILSTHLCLSLAAAFKFSD